MATTTANTKLRHNEYYGQQSILDELYENPYDVKGIIKSTNPKEQSKGICIDKDVGTW